MLNTLRRAGRFYQIIKKVSNFPGAWYLAKKPSNQPINYDEISWVDNKLIIKQTGISLTKREFEYFFNDLGTVLNFFNNVHVKREDNKLIACAMGAGKKVNILIDRQEVVALINELFLEEGYRIECSEDFIVIDIGMNMGLASLYFASKDNVRMVYGFEPFPAPYQAAVQNFSLNPEIKNKIVSEMAGLGKLDEILKVAFDTNSVLTSSTSVIVDSKAKSFVNVKICNVSTALKSIIEKHSGKQKILLKIDCEGAEYEIIEDLKSSGLLSNVDAIILEWHMKGAEPILKVLNAHSFLSYTRKLPHSFPIGLIYATKLGS